MMSPYTVCPAVHSDHANHTLIPTNICITTSPLQVSVKELFILSLIFILLIYSVLAFLRHWNKNYRNVNHLPQFSEAERRIENGN